MRMQQLIDDFWRWRVVQQPRTPDDITRVPRPAEWTPDFSASAVARYRDELAEFEARWSACDPADEVADAVDHRLLGSALARVRWELDVLRQWQTNPAFYVDQTVGVVFDVLTVPRIDEPRLRDVRAALASTPRILADGRKNLDRHAYREYAELCAVQLAAVDADLTSVVEALIECAPADYGADERDDLARVARAAGEALVEYREWLAAESERFDAAEPVGREAFEWFLRNVALLPYSVDDLLAIGQREADRATFLEHFERSRNGTSQGARPTPVFATGAEQSAGQVLAEQEIRDFYVTRGLLSQPDELRHYHTHPMPEYLAPIAWAGCADDLTGQDRLDEDGAAYFPPPGPELPYFYAANAHDPRAGIAHEGVHYQQLTMSWRHPRSARRWYYDSCANEGIAFYNEEMMLAAGLFDDAPTTRAIIYNFMRLRALRVVVDVGLASGTLDIPAAAKLLKESVPMDAPTAREEAAFFSSTPGQAMTYQVGKTQILSLLNDAMRLPGFDLQAFHDRLWREGNVPIALQRWELLGDRSEVDLLDHTHTEPHPGGAR